MPVTVDEVERELQEEFARKEKLKKASASDDAWLPDFGSHRCRLVLVVGIFCALLMLAVPQSNTSPFLSLQEPPQSQEQTVQAAKPRSSAPKLTQEAAEARARERVQEFNENEGAVGTAEGASPDDVSDAEDNREPSDADDADAPSANEASESANEAEETSDSQPSSSETANEADAPSEDPSETASATDEASDTKPSPAEGESPPDDANEPAPSESASEADEPSGITSETAKDSEEPAATPPDSDGGEATQGRRLTEAPPRPVVSDVTWVIPLDCAEKKGITCTNACEDQGLTCDSKALKELRSGSKMKAAVKAAGASCSVLTKIKISGDWDGPLLSQGECTFTGSSGWQPSCDAAPHCGWNRVCACKKQGQSQGAGRKKIKTALQAPLMWWDVAARVPPAIKGDWASETLFLDRLLRNFGKLQPGYKGPQRVVGFRPGQLFDEKGMFSFDDSVRSVAIDVGAATNPLSFDLPVDSSQVAFFVEPVQWKTIEEDVATNFKRVKANGGCGKQYDPACIHDRALVFPAAVSENLAHATFHVTSNPYCGSLEAFTGSKEVHKSKNPDVRGIFDACYKDAGQTRDVPTISLKSIIERIPKSISVKYIKIDAQGHDFKVLLSAGDQMSRIDYVRLEMQVDPPPGFKLVKDVPSYAEIKKRLEGFGFKHEGAHACHFDGGASPFSKAVKEMECVFCRRPPCVETGRAPMGPNPASKSMMSKYYGQEYVQPPPWKIPADMDTRESRS